MGIECPSAQHSASEENQAIGKSKGGNTTKIHMAVGAFGLPIAFELTGGEVHGCKAAPKFIGKLPVSEYKEDAFQMLKHNLQFIL